MAHREQRRSKLIHSTTLRAFFYFSIFLCLSVEGKKGFRQIPPRTKVQTIGAADCTVKLALLLCNETSTSITNNFDRQINQTLVLIKSILITLEKDGCVHVLIITNKKSHFDKLETKIFANPEKWDTGFTVRLKLEYVELKYPAGTEWMRGLYQNHPCSSFRLFLPDVLPYDSVILSDTDVIYLRDITELWAELSKFKPSTVASLTPIVISPRTPGKVKPGQLPKYQKYGVSSALMIMNLTRMRTRQWSREVLAASAPFLSQIRAGSAEQDMLNVYFYHNPEEMRPLSCDWNFTRNKCQQGICSRKAFSALHGVSHSFMEEGREPLFRSVFQTFENTELTSNFDLRNLTKRLERGLNNAKYAKNATKACFRIPNFTELAVMRLKQKLRS